MLRHLHIKNFAIIDSCELTFNEGFTVLTGETGAGKSIIIDALSLLLGQTASEDMIKSGAQEATIEGIISLSSLPENLALFVEPGEEAIIYRKITRSKDNQIRINGQSVTLKALKKATEGLANIIGQHEHMSLLTPDSQLNLLDFFSPALSIQTDYQNAYSVFCDLTQKMQNLTQHQHDLTQKMEFLSFQVQDLELPGFIHHEETDLETQKKALKDSHKLKAALSAIQEALETISIQTHTCLKEAVNLGDKAPLATSLTTWTTPIHLELSDKQDQVLIELQRITALEDLDIDAIESRLDTIFKYKTKYKMPTLDALIDHLNSLKTQLEEMKNVVTHQEDLQRHLEEARLHTQEKALEWHKLRIKGAQKLGELVQNKMEALHFSYPRFEVHVNHRSDDLSLRGGDSVVFMISTNPGEPLKPLAKVASGGELSRLMLALKAVFFQSSPVPTLIFDEIDVGIGGIAATKIGEYLKLISQNAQVFCITHLPQIAAQAHSHFVVSKSSTSEKTTTLITPLRPEDVQNELKRMVGGEIVLNRMHD